MTIDLRTCIPGDQLISSHGMILTYIEYCPEEFYPHRVMYPDGASGSRNDDGTVFKLKRLPSDHDIVAILRD